MRAVAATCLLAAACGRVDFSARVGDAGGDASNSCAFAELLPPSGAISGDLPAAGDDHVGSCGGAGMADHVYAFDVAPGSGLLVSADMQGTTADTLLYVRSDCATASSEIACDDTFGFGNDAAITIDSVPAGRLYAFIDGSMPGHYEGVIAELLPAGASCDASNGYARCAPELQCATVCVPADCPIAQALSGMTSYTVTVTTFGGTNQHAGTCAEGNNGGSNAPEVILALQLAAAATDVEISTISPNTNFDTVVYVRASCAGPELACNDDEPSGMTQQSDLHTGPLAAGTYDIFIDGFSWWSGTADVTITITP